MFENIILWLIIIAATIYCGRNIYRTLSGKSKGCGCGCDCSEEKTSSPPLQQSFPDLTDEKDKSES
jgi:hypothetical protein